MAKKEDLTVQDSKVEIPNDLEPIFIGFEITNQREAEFYAQSAGYLSEVIVTQDKNIYSLVDQDAALNHCVYRNKKYYIVNPK